jgi:hypothetical protein
MSPRRIRPAAVALAIASLVVVGAACGSSDGPEPVASGRPAAEGATPPGGGDVSAPTEGDSVVAGVSPEELRALVVQEPGRPVRSRPGPTAQRIELADGTPVWRVRVPGEFAFGGARPFVLVDGRLLGQAIPTPALDALVVIAPDDAAVAAGAEVAMRWEQGTPEVLGSLEVLR